MDKNNDKELPLMMYVHGFMSGGAYGSKQKELMRRFKGRYRVIAPELDADPEYSLSILNQTIKEEQPEIIVGTSLGGWMAMMCDSGDAELVIVNPVINPYITLARWLNQEQNYFCRRLDGIQTYTLTHDVLDKYLKYDSVIEIVKEKRNRLHALCSTKDQLLGTTHIHELFPLLPEDRLRISASFQHQCAGDGLKHLYEILENLIKQKEL